MHDNWQSQSKARTTDKQQQINKIAVLNRLEILKVLSGNVLREVESLREDKDAALQHKINLTTEIARFEADLIRGALIRTGGRQRLAAQLLGIKTTTLNNKIRRYGITSNGLANFS